VDAGERAAELICYAPRPRSISGEGKKKMKIERTIEIAAPPRRIWLFFTDPENMPGIEI